MWSAVAGDGAASRLLVDLPPGPLAAGVGDAGVWAYFPVDALIGWLPSPSPAPATATATATAVALVGCHGGVLVPHVEGTAWQAHVVSPGRAYRLDWSVVRQDPERFAPWLWHGATAAQSLINQMAWGSFCARHHSPSQRLASWLLYGLAQTPKAELTLNLKGQALGLQTWLTQALGQAPQAPGAPAYVLEGDCLRTSFSAQLVAQACACHTHMASSVLARP